MVCAGIDTQAFPRARRLIRSYCGLTINAAIATGIFGAVIVICGNPVLAVVVVVALQALFIGVSNAKFVMLGEPLLFTDLALIGALFKHPQFYMSAIKPRQGLLAITAFIAVGGMLVWFSPSGWEKRIPGLAFAVLATAVLTVFQLGRIANILAPVPAALSDTSRLGLWPVMALYSVRWRSARDAIPCTTAPVRWRFGCPDLIFIVQCESYADPCDLGLNQPEIPATSLPGLAAAKAAAIDHGKLLVSGFGAYTMRTEYGVLFGRDESALGFRCYDPFLTAIRDKSYAMPHRIEGWTTHFVHPHDMNFYSRKRIMAAAGFTELSGEEMFSTAQTKDERYVSDKAIADFLIERARTLSEPGLFYAVTIANHGPWTSTDSCSNEKVYLDKLGRSDAMLIQLMAGIAGLKRPALLVFFGDHRPSIPGIVKPGKDLHTPYVMLRTDSNGRFIDCIAPSVDRTPADLHHQILAEMERRIALREA